MAAKKRNKLVLCLLVHLVFVTLAVTTRVYMSDANPTIIEEVLGVLFVPQMLILGSVVNGLIDLLGLQANITTGYIILSSIVVLPISYLYSVLLLSLIDKLRKVLNKFILGKTAP